MLISGGFKIDEYLEGTLTHEDLLNAAKLLRRLDLNKNIMNENNANILDEEFESGDTSRCPKCKREEGDVWELFSYSDITEVQCSYCSYKYEIVRYIDTTYVSRPILK